MICSVARAFAPAAALAALLAPALAAGPVVPDPQAVREVLAGKRAVANAAWWGFDAEDATGFLQAAISSGARRVVVPNMGRDWVVRPIGLAGDQELILERGVVVTAKRGEFRGTGDCLLRASGVANLTIRGYGASIRMQKEDYIVGGVLKDYFNWNRWFGQYPKAEWRSGLSLEGCTNVRVLGLTIRDTGGDGVYVAAGRNPACRDIVLKDVVCDNNYRQGISIISVEGFRAERCVFRGTWGTPPSSGVDIEPDSPNECARNIVFRKCRFTDNYGDGIEVFLANLNRSSAAVSIRFEECDVTSRRGAGIRVAYVNDDGPAGLIEFIRCRVTDTVGYGIKVQGKSPQAARVRFADCTLRNAANTRGYADEWTPIWLRANVSARAATYGGITFERCTVEDRYDRPAVTLKEPAPASDVVGEVLVMNPFGAKMALPVGVKLDLVVKEAPKR